jgi:spore maturation protein CgeB
MRVLAVPPGPRYSTYDVYRGWVAGLRALGVDVVEDGFDARLEYYGTVAAPGAKPLAGEDAARLASRGVLASYVEARPDVVLVITGMALDPRTLVDLRAAGATVVLVCTESPYLDLEQAMAATRADLVLVNDPVNLDRLRAANANVHWAPAAYDPTLHRPIAPAGPPVDFGFVGTGYRSRIDFLEAVDWTCIDAVLGGGWDGDLGWPGVTADSPIRPFIAGGPHDWPRTRTAALYARSRVGANLYRHDCLGQGPEALTAAGWAMGPREVELAACGTFFIREPRGEGDQVLHMLPTCTDPAEFGDLVRWWATHDNERQAAAAAARAAVADRTFTAIANRLLEELDRQPVTV